MADIIFSLILWLTPSEEKVCSDKSSQTLNPLKYHVCRYNPILAKIWDKREEQKTASYPVQYPFNDLLVAAEPLTPEADVMKKACIDTLQATCMACQPLSGRP